MQSTGLRASDSFPDDGRVEPRGGVIYEYDTPSSPLRYEEAWVQQPWDHGLVAHLTLRDERDLESREGALDQRDWPAAAAAHALDARAFPPWGANS